MNNCFKCLAHRDDYNKLYIAQMCHMTIVYNAVTIVHNAVTGARDDYNKLLLSPNCWDPDHLDPRTGALDFRKSL